MDTWLMSELWQQTYNVCLLFQMQPHVWLLSGSEVNCIIGKCWTTKQPLDQFTQSALDVVSLTWLFDKAGLDCSPDQCAFRAIAWPVCCPARKVFMQHNGTKECHAHITHNPADSSVGLSFVWSHDMEAVSWMHFEMTLPPLCTDPNNYIWNVFLQS